MHGVVRISRSGGWGAVTPDARADTIRFPPEFLTTSLRQLPTLVDWMGTTRRMFHVKHPQGVLIISVLLATVLAACAGTRSPEGWASPTEAGDVTLVQEEPGVIAALTLSDSSAVVRWRFPADGQDDPDLTAIYGDPLITGDRVYIAGYSGHVVALDLATGRPIDGWPSLELPAHVVAAPAMSDTHLFVATDRGRIVPIDLATGADSPAILDVGERIWSPLYMRDGTLYVAGLDRTVRALDPQTGAERWKAELGGSVAGEFTIEGDTMYVGAFDRRLYALDAGTGGERWSVSGDGWFWARPLLTADMLYAATVEGSIYAIDPLTGNTRWTASTAETQVRAAPALSGGTLVVVSREGDLVGLDPSNGTERWRGSIEGDGEFLADPIERNGGLIYVTTDGSIYRIDPGTGTYQRIYGRS